ncbi:hemolysin family protein [Dehalococcoidia bacterium]|nr:hemolysin family protein [Dehalococcoidia bacterium]
MDTSTMVILMVVFLGLSAFFSSSETAYFTLQRVRLQQLLASGDGKAERLAKMKERPERFLATILLGNNMVNTALTALATALAITILGNDQRGSSILVATAVVTVGIVVMGEAVPKTLAARYPERVALFFVRLWELVERILFPLATVLYALSRVLTRPFGAGVAGPMVSEEELRTLVRVGASEGTVEEAQAEIISKAFRLGDLQAEEIMTPRTEISWIREEATLAEFLRIYTEEPHTRFPVCRGEVDNVRGLLYAKDVLKAFAERKLSDEDPIVPLMRSAYFYPESKPVDDLFVEMRSASTQMVMLVNEHGGIAGLLTMKQLVAEIVGPIDEEEEEVNEAEVEDIDDHTVLVDAGMRVEEANERLGIGLPEGEDYDTLAGLVLNVLGHVPRQGEFVRQGDVSLVVTKMKGVKIERLLVRRP